MDYQFDGEQFANDSIDQEYKEMRERDITLKYFFKVWPVSTSCAVRRLRAVGIDISLQKFQEILNKPESQLETMERYYLTRLIELIRDDMTRIKDFVRS